jgi:hypothetical protein
MGSGYSYQNTIANTLSQGREAFRKVIDFHENFRRGDVFLIYKSLPLFSPSFLYYYDSNKKV